MTTLAVPAPTSRQRRTAVLPPTASRLLTSEWIKLRTLRSTWWALALSVALVVAMAMSRTSSIAQVPEAAGFVEGAVYVTSGAALAQLVFCTLGVLAITGEYASGQIRTSLAAAPTRVPVLWTKLAVIVATVLVTSLVAVGLAWAASARWFGATSMTIDLTQADDARIMLGTPLYLATVTALAFAIGALVRTSAAGVAATLGLVLVVENAIALIPWAPLQAISPYLPATAGNRLVTSDVMGAVTTTSTNATLSPWQGYGVLVAWVLVLLAVAAVRLRREDA
ncbi:ABC transporter permease subunit [Actinotalea ferrariae]|uniref:ABC transporter permease subunit n=1 Tax=Actinotalea ferrariae TaxID=1386098 RepID=UPI001C8C0493|nr:ABC transporter permease subunit [Actinotalea ferrariae]MBX9246138.1 ABC transporter permease subunit [Actinotalea ferrariae]